MKREILHYKTITPLLHDALKILMASGEFAPFRLIGGTALSLQRGHRESMDIDLFTDVPYGSIQFEQIDKFLKSQFSYVDSGGNGFAGMGKSYFIGTNKDDSVKLDVYYTTDPFIQNVLVTDGIRLATVDEITAMKMDVISRAGRKKDFWDLHELKDDYSLKHMLELHKERHLYTHDSELIKEKLQDFANADLDFDPVCLKNKQWGLIKLDMVDFAWSDYQTVGKTEHLPVQVIANNPRRLQVTEGIDYVNTLLYVRFNPSLRGSQVQLTLKNHSGETCSTPIDFDSSGQISLVLSDVIEDVQDYTFFYLEFKSAEDLNFEFWLEDQEGGYFDA